VIFDTLISDGDTWNAIAANMRLIYRERNLARKLKLRQEVARKFFEYVEVGIQDLVDQALGRGLPMQFCQNPISRQKVAFNEELTRASLSAKRLYGGSEIAADEMPLFQSPLREKGAVTNSNK